MAVYHIARWGRSHFDTAKIDFRADDSIILPVGEIFSDKRDPYIRRCDKILSYQYGA